MAEIMCTECIPPHGPFKDLRGLNGHRRFVHGSLSVPMDGPGGEGPVTRRDLQGLEEYLGQMLCEAAAEIKAMAKELANVKELVGSRPLNQHPSGLCLDNGCTVCPEQIANVYREGREAMDREHREIPEVQKALETHEMLSSSIESLR